MRFLALPLSALLLCAPLGSASASPATAKAVTPETAQLIARYLDWRGGKAFAALKTYYLIADVEADGLKGTTTEWRDRSNRSRDEYDLGVTKGLSVHSAKDGWNRDDALVTPQGRQAVEDDRRALAIEFGDAFRGDASVQRLADEQFDGKTFAVLRITFGDADSYDLVLDPSTGAQYGRRTKAGGAPNFTRLSDWRLINGVRFPFLREAYRSNGKLDSTIRVRSIETNAKFANSLFAKPEGKKTLSFAAGTHSTGRIKYNPFTGTRIYIPAKVNGHDVEVLLDSGADSSVLDKGFADSIGSKSVKGGIAIGTGGETEAGLANNVHISIGNMTLDLPTISVVDLASVGKRIGIPLPVILGRDVFLQSIVDIDPSGPTIAFHDPATFTPPAGATLVPLDPQGGLRVVQASVEGQPDAPMLFDLGNGGYMTLGASYWQAHNLLDGRKSSTRSSGAIGGEQINHVATLKTVRFAGVTFRDVPAQFDAPNIERDSDRDAGNIGMPILKRFRMMIDFQNSRMYVIPIAERVSQPFDRDRSGLRAVQDGDKLVIRHVSKGSPAETAGWKDGDVITAIDGQAIGPQFASSQLSLWAWRPVGTVVTLTMADGSTRKLALADYF